MPQPTRPTPYARHNKALLQAVKAVAEETMTRAAEEIHASKPEFENGLVMFPLMGAGRGDAFLRRMVVLV